MHSSNELTTDNFVIEVDGKRVASMADVFPRFNALDRLGIVVRGSLDGIWTSNLITATVTAFYDLQRSAGPDFFIYPDYFIVHAGCRAGEYGMLDIWPNHKSVQVADDPEEILRAINDRAINILTLSSATFREGALEKQTRSSAMARIKFALLHRNGAMEPGADIRIQGHPSVEAYVEDVISRTAGLSIEERSTNRANRQTKLENGRATEWYRRVSTAEALKHL